MSSILLRLFSLVQFLLLTRVYLHAPNERATYMTCLRFICSPSRPRRSGIFWMSRRSQRLTWSLSRFVFRPGDSHRRVLRNSKADSMLLDCSLLLCLSYNLVCLDNERTGSGELRSERFKFVRLRQGGQTGRRYVGFLSVSLILFGRPTVSICSVLAGGKITHDRNGPSERSFARNQRRRRWRC